MNSLNTLIFLSICSAIFALLLQHTHFLMSILCLEGIMLNMVLFVPLILYENSMEIPAISIIMLTLGACEASLGLGLMVKMSRSYGSDMIKSFMNMKC